MDTNTSPFSAEAFTECTPLPFVMGFAGPGGAIDERERRREEADKRKPVLRGGDVSPRYVNPDALAIQHPSRSVLLGATESGKTFFLVGMLDRKRIVPAGKVKLKRGQRRKMWANFDRVIWLAPRFSIDQPVIKRLKRKMGDQLELVPVSVANGVGEAGAAKIMDQLKENSDAHLQTLVVNDDLAAATTDKATLQLIKELSISGRHLNTSITTLTQRAFTKGSRTARLQVNYWVIFRVGASEATAVLRQLYPIKWREVFAAWQKAVSSGKQGSYLMIDQKVALDPNASRRVLQFRDSALDNVVLGIDTDPTKR